ncbi:L,D-transpeptidase [Roseomonas sp. NAR14]|uniref:L,D-transpeptidase n=1 Tax=Roseomonas acroporae TaxID=2937791 RepID=A0A9X1YB01_9PROT|nr:L,D-transpeptidase [Roseomonas acroporae]MCK8783196.1 L,D-transpeptidase [Roseomonas acroporae]
MAFGTPLSDFLGALGGIADFIEDAADRIDKNPLANPPAEGDWIVVSEDRHVIVLYHEGTKVRTITDFSTGGSWDGKPHPTPTGKHKVISKDADHVSSSYKDKSGNPAPMPLYVQFAPAVGFHVGNPQTRSHGCIHLTRADAKFVFDWSHVGKTHVWVLPRGPKKREEDE